MSQLTSSCSQSQGNPPNNFNFWPEFVTVVLEVTLFGYLKMREDFKIDDSFEEDQITINLEDFIEPFARKHPLRLQVQSQVQVYSQAMKNGSVTTKKAKRIDLKLWNPLQNHRHIYFSWEAKKLGNAKAYVTDGMIRFISGAYSSGLRNAGMLGYCTSQPIEQIASKINQHIKDVLTDVDQLSLVNSVEQQLSIHRSQSVRADGSPIELHHFFLTF